ncbi:recombination protein NinG [Pseudomonas syringae pv. syringae]|uniref:recombination protein NinG n=1 Tax=Pseudomonas TaxID=286 RepID=UPI001F4356BF|nr:recombination protein NinG [Pseudomonas syringae]MCF5179615.1 recombination protein NinG [Pseudomonas syringae]MCF5312501.1 recombination protein NinG [Pseudomonas syringae]MCF5361114.1 recombination protein NinG [Pseudomonas syringae]MCF5392419.1 recombination protein NinG [Pseudomonas syringae]MCF5397119.1 recombination protein NinG [Pseudomonas syringae]
MKRTPLQRKTPLTSGSTRRKRCPECRVMFTPARARQAVCGEIECAIAHGQSEKGRAIAGKALAEVGRREIKVRKEALKNRSDHMKDTQQAFNEWVRHRDAALPCVSCGRHHEGKYDAGHYRTVRSNPALRFEPLNCHKQCVPCNQHKSGNVIEYRIELVRRIGIANVEWLEGPHEPQKYTVEELKALTANYRALTKELKRASA